MTDVTELTRSIQEVRFNPAAIQRKSLELLETVSNGEIDVVDPSNPFVFLLEASAINASATMVECEALTRKQYPSMALTEEDLYLHMSDKDYIGRFSTPGKTVFTLLFGKDELKQKALATEVSGVNKLVIPKNTEFKVADYTFTMQYPIELRVMDYGGIQVVYDNTNLSPLETLKDNIVDWSIVKVDEIEYIMMKVPVNQFEITPKYNQISKTVPFNVSYTFNDQFYYCRVYVKGTAGVWTEIRTTHTEQVFDPTKPTAVLSVVQNTLKVQIPQVYVDSGLVSGTARVDIYTSKGDLNLLLDSYQVNAFTVRWLDHDLGEEISEFSAPLNSFGGMGVYSDAAVAGGSNGISFDVLRERVLNNALGSAQIPITDAQLSARLENKGYESIKDVDNITDRVYLASKKLPTPTATETKNAAGCLVGTVQTDFEDLAGRSGVYDNGLRVTTSPNTLFKLEDGIIKLAPNSEVNVLKNSTGNELIDQVNNSTYLFSPFHHVFDGAEKFFEVRPYYLDNPSEERKEFVEENTSLGIYISTASFNIRKEETGYVIQVTTRSDDIVKDLADNRIVPVLSFKPVDQRSEVYLEGELILKDENEERVYEFHLTSNLDIDSNHNLIFDAFKMYDNDNLLYKSPLTTTFDLVYYIRDLPGDYSELSYRPNNYLIGGSDYGAIHEKLTVKFGSFLDGLWNRSRSTLGTNVYRTYEEDIYAYYEENVYQRDTETGSLVLGWDSNGDLTYTIIHTKGDPVLDSDGNHVIKHKKGDVVVDADGNPTVINDRAVIRESDLFLIDGRYLFSTYEKDLEYLKELPKTVVGWLEGDIKEFKDWLIEQTEMYLYPQKTIGKTKFLVLDSEEVTLDLEQSFIVTYYLESEKFNDEYLRESLRTIAIDVIGDELQKTKIKMNEIVSKLTATVGEDVVSLEVSGLGGSRNLATMSLIDKSNRCSIRKKLKVDLDGTFKVADDVEVLFVRHQP